LIFPKDEEEQQWNVIMYEFQPGGENKNGICTPYILQAGDEKGSSTRNQFKLTIELHDTKI
jgi:hypothetical protein